MKFALCTALASLNTRRCVDTNTRRVRACTTYGAAQLQTLLARRQLTDLTRRRRYSRAQLTCSQQTARLAAAVC